MRDPDGQLLCTSLLRACCLRECKLAAPAALPGACALSSGLVPVRVLFGRLKAPSQRSKWKSSDRCNGRDRPQVSQRNAPPPNRAGTGTGDRLRPFVSVHCMRLYCTINHRRSAFPSLIHGCGSISHGRETRCRRSG